ncbi:twin-arginine translocation signal domain-containing protein [Shewanella sp. WXL01]|uniref:Twin-arginine translocation signal domain-containing protein n=1 Tax=Shewanella maritima TaxID=2520507 RepID=A0A411PHL4_9GAMM|nr:MULTISPECIES: twin-arginine translocation signal domain-containing protein [Shewanella]NKF52538.1 twin-arginine translocation signal domain-containing protein [Shewanella sp. WXL01]QBF82944.1 twin-arginine translocation signal domain-containing protein [Shewanella maritima]
MSKQQPDLNRRSLLKAITVGGTASAALAVSGISIAQAQAPSAINTKSKGYQETAHVRSYYDSLRG